MKSFCISISEIAIITGDNTFKPKREYLIDFWKKNSKEDYENYKKITEFVKETDDDIIKKISNKNNIDISIDIAQCIKSGNTNDLNFLKKNIINKMDKLSETDKNNITKAITNVTNTKFGIRNEHDISNLYEAITGSKIIKDNKFTKKTIVEYNNVNIMIGGKIDGFNSENNTLIEIKNRMHKLFFTLREYEKIQIMSYLHLFGLEKGHLVEAHKKKDQTDINIIEVLYDTEYMNNIISKIIDFINFYLKFIIDHEFKINLLKNNNEINFCV